MKPMCIFLNLTKNQNKDYVLQIVCKFDTKFYEFEFLSTQKTIFDLKPFLFALKDF